MLKRKVVLITDILKLRKTNLESWYIFGTEKILQNFAISGGAVDNFGRWYDKKNSKKFKPWTDSNIEAYILNDFRTRDIITRENRIFITPFLKVKNVFSGKFFSENSAFMYG